jgi:hypothetical protein
MRGAAIGVAGNHDLRRAEFARVRGDRHHNLLALRRQRRLVGLEKHNEVARRRKALRTGCKCHERQSDGKLLVRGAIPVGAGGWWGPIFSGGAERVTRSAAAAQKELSAAKGQGAGAELPSRVCGTRRWTTALASA